MNMSKHTAMEMFGTSADIARALNLSPRTVQLWPDELDQKQTDMVVGAAIRLGIPLPAGYLTNAKVIQSVM